ncbi:MAG TPA: hypothetical protein VMW50_14030 [Dehalococcoidia bacterium]|nr:hypothetical protein [Dehalococcoidia bacterium]
MSEDKIYTEEDWDRAREEIRRHDEEKLSELVCPCGHRYLKGEEKYIYCPMCGADGPGSPFAELKDVE